MSEAGPSATPKFIKPDYQARNRTRTNPPPTTFQVTATTRFQEAYVRAIYRASPPGGRPGSGRGADPKAQLHRHGAHPAGAAPRGGGARSAGARVAGYHRRACPRAG